MKKPVALIIMDGFGESNSTVGNAVKAANTPNLDRIEKTYPTTLIKASGLDVGLPDGQMGNSEVGHTNIGAGRIVYQDLTRITKSIQDGDFFTNEVLNGASLRRCRIRRTSAYSPRVSFRRLRWKRQIPKRAAPNGFIRAVVAVFRRAMIAVDAMKSIVPRRIDRRNRLQEIRQRLRAFCDSVENVHPRAP